MEGKSIFIYSSLGEGKAGSGFSIACSVLILEESPVTPCELGQVVGLASLTHFWSHDTYLRAIFYVWRQNVSESTATL